jgi:hypothetical protein
MGIDVQRRSSTSSSITAWEVDGASAPRSLQGDGMTAFTCAAW